MEFFSQGFLDTVKEVAVVVGVLYAPFLFANGVMDAIIKFRQLTGRDK